MQRGSEFNDISREVIAPDVLAIVDSTLRELHAGAPDLPTVTLASTLDGDLGFDSLARTELLLRIERRFGIRLPDDTFQRAETVGDLLAAAQRADRVPSTGPGDARSGMARLAEPEATPVAARPREASADAEAPTRAQTLLEVLEWHLHVHADHSHLTCLVDDTEHALSYHQLAEEGAAVAAGLQHAGV